jgi:hypothetical protein
MNQPASPSARKGATWIGVAIVGVVVVGAASYYFDIPPRGDNLTGTVTPAQRYRAEQQVGAQDVKLADQSVAQALQSEMWSIACDRFAELVGGETVGPLEVVTERTTTVRVPSR